MNPASDPIASPVDLTALVGDPTDEHRGWTFLSSHAKVLLAIGHHPQALMREIAQGLGLTERAVQRIVNDLERAGYLTRLRVGRRNRYEVHADRPMRHAPVAHRQIRALLGLIEPE
jgi:DNA-binding transcriptional ArsR family regulator